jgi:hypothetical protein
METKPQHSSERAIAWAKGMIERKRAEEKKMVEDFKSNPEAQALVEKLFKKTRLKDGYGKLPV